MYEQARALLHGEEPLQLPKAVVDKVWPLIRGQNSRDSFLSWVSRTKKLLQVVDYLPFLPYDRGGHATYQDYERLSAPAVKELRALLDVDPNAGTLSTVGRAFRNCILGRGAFVWEVTASETLERLTNEALISKITTLRAENHDCDRLGKVWNQPQNSLNLTKSPFDLDSLNQLIPFSSEVTLGQQGLEEDIWNSALYTGTSMHFDNNSWATLNQMWTSSLPSDSTFATLENLFNTGPRQQPAVINLVPDTCQSIMFAVDGNIDGLKHLFQSKRAFPTGESISRRYSLLRVSSNDHLPQHMFFCMLTTSVGDLRRPFWIPQLRDHQIFG